MVTRSVLCSAFTSILLCAVSSGGNFNQSSGNQNVEQMLLILISNSHALSLSYIQFETRCEICEAGQIPS